MIRSIAILVTIIAGPSAHAADAVTPELVCNVKDAIRHRSPAWDREMCSRVAKAINETPRPRTTLAMAILESDLRPDVAVEAKAGTFDVGLLAVRCVLQPALLPVDQSAGRCLVGPARGYTLDELKDPVVNIRVAAEIMAQKRERHGNAWLSRYNGGTREHGYAGKVRAVAAALGGVRVGTRCKRVRKLIEQILAVVAPRVAMGER